MKSSQKHQNTLPHGDVGRIINSFVSGKHQDAEEWQRQYRQTMYDSRKTLHNTALEQIRSPVCLIAVNNFNKRYVHARRLPDWRRSIKSNRFTLKLTLDEHILMEQGGLPPSWYPRKTLPILMRIHRDSQY